MAQGLDSKTLKRSAIEKMREGRVELDTEIQRMRVQYSPSRIARSTMEKHAATIIGVTFGIGLVAALILSRRHATTEPSEKPDKKSRGKEKEKKEKKASFLGTLLSSAAQTATPLAIRWFLNSRFNPTVPPTTAPDATNFTPGGQ